ncbi:hypothetical protein D9615_005383 [Tricholomella constricta]|uniref:Uncharacterized protein n=1 Tax=Tricholomella constricta TaxID=117010 RepID=A0A8H5HE42_9AGAR|nr:hypothetical protein D9615_005383 [Tricholomella constricta]
MRASHHDETWKWSSIHVNPIDANSKWAAEYVVEAKQRDDAFRPLSAASCDQSQRLFASRSALFQLLSASAIIFQGFQFFVVLFSRHLAVTIEADITSSSSTMDSTARPDSPPQYSSVPPSFQDTQQYHSPADVDATTTTTTTPAAVPSDGIPVAHQDRQTSIATPVPAIPAPVMAIPAETKQPEALRLLLRAYPTTPLIDTCTVSIAPDSSLIISNYLPSGAYVSVQNIPI